MVTDIKARIADANGEAVQRMNAADLVLRDVAPAIDVIPGLDDRMVLHAGPPITWDRMCGAMKGALAAAVVFEGWAAAPDEARGLLGRGDIRLEPNHHHSSVGPMAGTITRSLPVFVVEDRTSGKVAYCRQAEGRQQFGDDRPDALVSLFNWRDTWAPVIGASLRHMGGLPLGPIIAKALRMGDELHNRPVAASAVFASILAAPMLEARVDTAKASATLRYLAGHELFFLGISMAAAKATADAARGIRHSTVVTAMARNGTEFGIQLSGLGDRWFTAPAPKAEGLYLAGYSEGDAGLDMGDSAITETVGWGGMVLGGAPGILALTGGTPEDAMRISREMREITSGTSTHFQTPGLGFAGAPVGIDIRKVIRTGITPLIDTAIAHREPGHPVIGAGLVRAPMACFEAALAAFAREYGVG